MGSSSATSEIAKSPANIAEMRSATSQFRSSCNNLPPDLFHRSELTVELRQPQPRSRSTSPIPGIPVTVANVTVDPCVLAAAAASAELRRRRSPSHPVDDCLRRFSFCLLLWFFFFPLSFSLITGSTLIGKNDGKLI